MDDIIARYEMSDEAREEIVRLVSETTRTKGKDFYRSLMGIQRAHKVANRFYVELLELLHSSKKGKGKRVPKKAPSLKSMTAVRNPDGSFTVTIVLPAELFSIDEVEVSEPEPVPAKKATPAAPKKASVNDTLKAKYLAAISGTDLDKKTMWDMVLYHSLDKGRVTLASISAKIGQPKEIVRNYLKTRYNEEVVSIVFFDGEDSVIVTWAPTTT